MQKLPNELLDKLQDARSDMEACKMLADNGVNVEEFEKSVSNEELNKIAGGWQCFGYEFKCPNCGEADRDNISRQFWASMFMDSATKYRCRTCNHYFKISTYGTVSDLGPAD
jgi:predicted RNA-binding Zn-ribbon protein involved in translation (DUF1610 family)